MKRDFFISLVAMFIGSFIGNVLSSITIGVAKREHITTLANLSAENSRLIEKQASAIRELKDAHGISVMYGDAVEILTVSDGKVTKQILVRSKP